jgi:hypothetical protein
MRRGLLFLFEILPSTAQQSCAKGRNLFTIINVYQAKLFQPGSPDLAQVASRHPEI